MTKEYFCKNVINDNVCGETDPELFDTNRKSYCIKCRRIMNNEYNKKKLAEKRKQEKLEQIEKKNNEVRLIESKVELTTEVNYINLIYDAINHHIVHKDGQTIPKYMDNMDSLLTDVAMETNDNTKDINDIRKILTNIQEDLKLIKEHLKKTPI